MRAYILQTGKWGVERPFLPTTRASCFIIAIFNSAEVAHQFVIEKYLPSVRGSWTEKYPNYWDGFGEYIKIEQWEVREK